MLLSLKGSSLILVNDIAGADVETLTDALKGDSSGTFNFSQLAGSLKDVATAIVAAGGTVPTTLDELLELPIDATVARLLMQQVFGSTEIIIGYDTCKVMCAVDLIDWECLEGVEVRSDIKITDLKAAHVKRSLQTWLPRGQGIEFQHAMEALGDVIGPKQKGFLGEATGNHHQNF